MIGFLIIFVEGGADLDLCPEGKNHGGEDDQDRPVEIEESKHKKLLSEEGNIKI